MRPPPLCMKLTRLAMTGHDSVMTNHDSHTRLLSHIKSNDITYGPVMGSLQHHRHGQRHTLSSQHLIGRAPGCHLRLDHPLVSGRHAEIRWTGACWEVCDLASTNGTYVDGRRLDRGEHRVVMSGSLLAFGHSEDVYELASDDAPHAAATCADGTRREARQGPLLLPSSEAAECMVYCEGKEWYVDWPEQSPRRIESGDTLAIREHIWTLDLPVVMAKTAAVGARELVLDSLTLRFGVSRDEEHVELELDNGIERVRLPPYACWYTLLILARERLSDGGRELSDAEVGWMDAEELQDKLGLESDALNQHVFRAKHALSAAGVRGYARIVERRRARKLRLGVGKIEIVSL